MILPFKGNYVPRARLVPEPLCPFDPSFLRKDHVKNKKGRSKGIGHLRRLNTLVSFKGGIIRELRSLNLVKKDIHLFEIGASDG